MTLIIVLNQSIEIKLEIQSNCVLALELRFWVHFDNWAKHNLYYNCKVTGLTKLLRKKKYEILEDMTQHWPLLLPYLYYNCTKELGILCSRQKKYELLENMKNPSYIGQNKYENLEEPSRTSHTRYSYFFNTFVKSCQIFILIQSPS